MKTTKFDVNKILLFWERKQKEWIQYNKLRDAIKDLLQKSNKPIKRSYRKEISERSIMRYLEELVKSGKLEKRIDIDHHTFYRPKALPLAKEILKAWVESQDEQVLNLMLLLTSELDLNLGEQKKTRQSLDLVSIFEKTTKTVLEDYKNSEKIMVLSERSP